MDGPSAARKSDGGLCKVLRPHGELTVVDGKFMEDDRRSLPFPES